MRVGEDVAGQGAGTNLASSRRPLGAARRRLIIRVCSALAVVLGLQAAMAGALLLSGDTELRTLAVALADHGVPAEAYVVESRDGGKLTQIRVTFDADGVAVVSELQGVTYGSADGGDWAPTPAGSHYGAPLSIRHLAADPEQVMASKDVEHWADHSYLSVDRGLVGVGLVPLLIAVITWLARGRPRWWLYLDNVGHPCWYCAHLQRDHDDSAECVAATRRGRCPCRDYGRRPQPQSGRTRANRLGSA